MVPMDHSGCPSQSSETVLSSILSLYLLSEPPAPASALPTVLHLIADRKPFANIDSTSQALHKWNTRVSSLIQSKSAESRYWGICLAKATISNGSEGVGHAVVWVKLLLTLLNRPEGSVLLERVIATLTTAFGLVSTHPALSRDLNALLPAFFTALLNFTSQTALLPASLTALHILIPDHASTFRPNFGRAGPLMLSLIEGPYSSDIQLLAGKVYVDLHHSAQKGMNSDHWRSCLVGVVSEVHFILDRMFEVVEEDRSKIFPSKGVGLKQLNGDYGGFMMSGLDRIKTLVALISQFLSLPTKQPVNVPVGHIVDLAMRVYSVGVDTRTRDRASKQDVSLLFSNITILYIQMNTLLSTTIKCVGKSFLPHFRSILNELIANLSTTDSGNHTFRTSSYTLLSRLLHNFGTTLHSTRETKSIDSLTKSLLSDIATLNVISTIPSLSVSSKSRKRKHNSTTPIELSSPSSVPTTQIVSAIELATEILHLTPLLNVSTRSSIDQVILSTALRTGLSDDILCALHRGIVTSVLFPAGIAIVPHAIRILERDSASDVEKVKDSAIKGLGEIEGLIHPRLPAQRGPSRQSKADDEEEEDEITEENEVGEEDIVMEEIVVVSEPLVAPEEPEMVSQPEVTMSTKVAAPGPVLPSFVTGSTNATPVATAGTASSVNSVPSAPVTIDRTSTPTAKVVTQKQDIFTMGAWKSQKEEDDDDEELEIPEIDMGFDSDEE